MLTHSVRLNDAELWVLGVALGSTHGDVKDEKAREKLQGEIKAACARIGIADVKSKLTPDLNWVDTNILAHIVWAGREGGILELRNREIIICGNCSASYSHAKYTRNSRWHNKGEPNFKRRIKCYGRQCLGMTLCSTCFDRLRPSLLLWLKDEAIELPKWLTGHEPEWKRYENMECTKCGWKGHEGLMERKPTIMGGGTYPGGCPKCEAVNVLFLQNIERRPGYVITPAKTKEK